MRDDEYLDISTMTLGTASKKPEIKLYPESATPSLRHLKLADGSLAVDIPHNADTSYLAHGFFRYIGKYPPQLISHILNKYQPEGPILDPMCGGGTTLVEARLRGIDAVGCDVNPVSRIISSVVATPLPPKALSNACAQLIKNLEMVCQTGAPLLGVNLGKKKSVFKLDFCGEYFDEVTASDIGHYLSLTNEAKPIFKNIFLLCLFSVLRKVSKANIKKMNLEIDDTKHKIVPFIDAITNQLNLVQTANREYEEWSHDCRIEVVDARDTKLKSGVGNIIFCHPPYFALYRYSSDVLRFELDWLGMDRKKIAKREMVDGFKTTDEKLVSRHISDMEAVIKEARRIAKPNGKFVIVTADSTLRKERLEILGPLIKAADKHDWHLERRIVRKIRHAQASYHRSYDSEIQRPDDEILIFSAK